MRVRILYFAAMRDRLGRDEEAVDLPAEVRTVQEFAAWAAVPAGVRVARNEAFAAPDEAIAAGDVLALIPPVSGG